MHFDVQLIRLQWRICTFHSEMFSIFSIVRKQIINQKRFIKSLNAKNRKWMLLARLVFELALMDIRVCYWLKSGTTQTWATGGWADSKTQNKAKKSKRKRYKNVTTYRKLCTCKWYQRYMTRSQCWKSDGRLGRIWLDLRRNCWSLNSLREQH